MRYLIRSATVISLILCVLANSKSSSRLAIVPSGFIISQITPEGVSPARRAKSTAVSVCPALFKTPPSFAIKGNMCPGRRKSAGVEDFEIITSIVFALSKAEIPVVVPNFGSASTETVKFVPFTSVLCSTIGETPILSAISRVIAWQISPLQFAAIKFIHSGVAKSAGIIRSPSFSLSSSSATITGFPVLKSSIASSIVLNFTIFPPLYQAKTLVYQGLKPVFK